MVKQIAGAPFASGGYGCVFRPPLKCKHNVVQERIEQFENSYVTKLMLRDAGNEEMYINKQILARISDLADFEKFFSILSSIFKCDSILDLTDDDDLTDYDRICKSLNANRRVVVSSGDTAVILGIKTTNINSRLQELMGIYMLDGGNDLHKTLSSMSRLPDLVSLPRIGQINIKLIELLKHAVLPMNSRGVFHCDIKPSNLLLKGMEHPLQLVDWGLSSCVDDGEPLEINGIKFMVNSIISILLLDDKSVLTNYNLDTPRGIDRLVYDIINAHVVNRDRELNEHYTYLMHLLTLCGNHKPKDVFKNYIRTTLDRFLYKKPDGQWAFNKEEHLKIFKHNVDICGILHCYINMINILPTRNIHTRVTSVPVATLLAIHAKLRQILNKYCYSDDYAGINIPVDELFVDMEEVTALCIPPVARQQLSVVGGRKTRRKNLH